MPWPKVSPLDLCFVIAPGPSFLKMAAYQLDNFGTKFKDLWRKGLKANHSLNTKAGEAWVLIDVALGCPPDLPPPAPLVQQGGKSRARPSNEACYTVTQQKVTKSDVEEHQVGETTATQRNIRNSDNLVELED